MTAICTVKREVYFRHSEERGAACVSARYVGNGLRRQEMLSYERYSDWTGGHRVRVSEDNGRTWSEWALQHEEWPEQGGFSKEESPTAWCYDPVSGKQVQFIFQRITVGRGNEAIAEMFKTGRQTYFDHNFWQVSDDDGLTWGKPYQLRYEAGGYFNPENWGDDAFQRTNQMYGSYSAVATREGTIVYPSAGIHVEVTDKGKKEQVDGVLCFIGKWNWAERTYNWEVSERVAVPHRFSGRGLLEPAIAELSDGRLWLVMRGSNIVFPPDWEGTVENGGHKWTSVSEDGGRTWSPVTDLRYETGESFYSPSAFAKLHRHSRSKKLYCFLNISPSPTRGNSPRYPLCIAEVEESIPALKKDTLTVIDDRDPRSDSSAVQFSNFSVFENRESGAAELYLTRFGEREDWRMADAYKYVITLL